MKNSLPLRGKEKVEDKTSGFGGSEMIKSPNNETKYEANHPPLPL